LEQGKEYQKIISYAITFPGGKFLSNTMTYVYEQMITVSGFLVSDPTVYPYELWFFLIREQQYL